MLDNMWDNIIGHERVKRDLKARIKSHHLPHALLLQGLSGIGKKKLAKTLAKTLLCERGGDSPCNACASCQAFEAGTHPDFFSLEPVSKGKSSRIIRLEEIHELLLGISRKPQLSRVAVVLIDDAECMNVPAANSLLKTLEEPAGAVYFLLVTGVRASILPTIVSRTMPVRFGELRIGEVEEILKREGVPEEQRKKLARYAFGSVGRALNALEGVGERGFSFAREVLKSLPVLSDEKVWYFSEKAAALTRDEARETFQALAFFLRDMLVLFHGIGMGTGVELYCPEEKELYAELLPGIDEARLYQSAELVAEYTNRQMSNASTKLLFEGFLLRLQA